MRITVCTGPNFPVPAIQGGGMARMWQRLSSHFHAKGHVVTLMARSWPGQASEEILDGVRVLRYGGFDQKRLTTWNIARDFPDALGLLSRLPPADILVVNDFWLPILRGLRGPDLGRMVVSVNRMPKGQYLLHHASALLVCPSEAVMQELKRQTPSCSEKVLMLPNPYDSLHFRPAKRSRAGLLYVGRLHPEKGLDLLLDAFRILNRQRSDITLTVVGSDRVAHGGGGTDYGNDLRARSEGLPVNWKGPVYDTASLAELYQSHLVFCYPSLSEHGETFGIAPLEAMACGCVPVVSGLDVFKSYLHDGINGLIFEHRNPDAAASLANRWLDVLDRPEAWLSLSNQGAKDALSFSIPVVGDRFLDVFSALP